MFTSYLCYIIVKYGVFANWNFFDMPPKCMQLVSIGIWALGSYCLVAFPQSVINFILVRHLLFNYSKAKILPLNKTCAYSESTTINIVVFARAAMYMYLLWLAVAILKIYLTS